MARPVERWLQTFMCGQYADVFERFGYKTLQSVCQLDPHQLRTMDVLPEHVEKIMENVSVLRQSYMAGGPDIRGAFGGGGGAVGVGPAGMGAVSMEPQGRLGPHSHFPPPAGVMGGAPPPPGPLGPASVPRFRPHSSASPVGSRLRPADHSPGQQQLGPPGSQGPLGPASSALACVARQASAHAPDPGPLPPLHHPARPGVGGNIGGFGDTRSPGPVVSPGNYGGDSRNQGPVLGNQDPASANNQQGPMSGHQGNFRDARAPGAMMQQRPGFIDGRNNYGGPVLQGRGELQGPPSFPGNFGNPSVGYFNQPQQGGRMMAAPRQPMPPHMAGVQNGPHLNPHHRQSYPGMWAPQQGMHHPMDNTFGGGAGQFQPGQSLGHPGSQGEHGRPQEAMAPSQGHQQPQEGMGPPAVPRHQGPEGGGPMMVQRPSGPTPPSYTQSMGGNQDMNQVPGQPGLFNQGEGMPPGHMHPHLRNRPQTPQQIADSILQMASTNYNNPSAGGPRYRHTAARQQSSPQQTMQMSPTMFSSGSGGLRPQTGHFVYPSNPPSCGSPMSPMQQPVQSPASMHSSASMPSSSPGPMRSPAPTSMSGAANATNPSPGGQGPNPSPASMGPNPSPGLPNLRSPTTPSGMQQHPQPPIGSATSMRSPAHTPQSAAHSVSPVHPSGASSQRQPSPAPSGGGPSLCSPASSTGPPLCSSANQTSGGPHSGMLGGHANHIPNGPQSNQMRGCTPMHGSEHQLPNGPHPNLGGHMSQMPDGPGGMQHQFNPNGPGMCPMGVSSNAGGYPMSGPQGMPHFQGSNSSWGGPMAPGPIAGPQSGQMFAPHPHNVTQQLQDGTNSSTPSFPSPSPSSSYSNTSSNTPGPSHRPAAGPSQTHPLNNPLQSLQKLVMLPESQVVDPKSVVNDACLPGNMESGEMTNPEVDLQHQGPVNVTSSFGDFKNSANSNEVYPGMPNPESSDVLRGQPIPATPGMNSAAPSSATNNEGNALLNSNPSDFDSSGHSVAPESASPVGKSPTKKRGRRKRRSDDTPNEEDVLRSSGTHVANGSLQQIDNGDFVSRESKSPRKILQTGNSLAAILSDECETTVQENNTGPTGEDPSQQQNREEPGNNGSQHQGCNVADSTCDVNQSKNSYRDARNNTHHQESAILEQPIKISDQGVSVKQETPEGESNQCTKAPTAEREQLGGEGNAKVSDQCFPKGKDKKSISKKKTKKNNDATEADPNVREADVKDALQIKEERKDAVAATPAEKVINEAYGNISCEAKPHKTAKKRKKKNEAESTESGTNGGCMNVGAGTPQEENDDLPHKQKRGRKKKQNMSSEDTTSNGNSVNLEILTNLGISSSWKDAADTFTRQPKQKSGTSRWKGLCTSTSPTLPGGSVFDFPGDEPTEVVSICGPRKLHKNGVVPDLQGKADMRTETARKCVDGQPRKREEQTEVKKAQVKKHKKQSREHKIESEISEYPAKQSADCSSRKLEKSSAHKSRSKSPTKRALEKERCRNNTRETQVQAMGGSCEHNMVVQELSSRGASAGAVCSKPMSAGDKTTPQMCALISNSSSDIKSSPDGEKDSSETRTGEVKGSPHNAKGSPDNHQIADVKKKASSCSPGSKTSGETSSSVSDDSLARDEVPLLTVSEMTDGTKDVPKRKRRKRRPSGGAESATSRAAASTHRPEEISPREGRQSQSADRSDEGCPLDMEVETIEEIQQTQPLADVSSTPPRRRRKQTLMPNFVGLDTHWGDSDDELSDAEFRSDSADFHSPRRAGSGSRASKSKSSRRTPAADGGKPRGQQTPRKSAAAAASGAARKRNRSASKSSVTSRSATPVKGGDTQSKPVFEQLTIEIEPCPPFATSAVGATTKREELTSPDTSVSSVGHRTPQAASTPSSVELTHSPRAAQKPSKKPLKNLSNTSNAGKKKKSKKGKKSRRRGASMLDMDSDNETKVGHLDLERAIKLAKSQGGKLRKLRKPEGLIGPVVRLKGDKENPTSVDIVNSLNGNASERARDGAVRRGSGGRNGNSQQSERHANAVTFPMSDTVPWICAFCGKSTNFSTLGDLFGPYFLENNSNSSGVTSATSTLTSPVNGPSATGGESSEENEQVSSRRKRRKLHGRSVSGAAGAASSGGGRESKRRRWASKEAVLHSPTGKTAPCTSPAAVPQEVWFHEDCVTWCHGVYLAANQVHGLDEAIAVAKQTVCSVCRHHGATLGCFSKGCGVKYHYMCAVEKDCSFDEENFSLFCPKHKERKLKMMSTAEHD